MTHNVEDAEMETDPAMEREYIRTAEAATSITKDTGRDYIRIAESCYFYYQRYWEENVKIIILPCLNCHCEPLQSLGTCRQSIVYQQFTVQFSPLKLHGLSEPNFSGIIL